MAIVVKHLDWDSSFFKKKIAMIRLEKESLDVVEKLLSDLKNEGYDLCYVFSDKKEIPSKILSSYNGLFVDSKVLFSEKISKFNKSSFISEYRGAPSCLYQLSIQAGTYSRFHVDSGFTEIEFIRFYERWVDNSVNGEIADVVFTYEQENIIKGFITAKKQTDTVVIGLLSVDERYRGEGIGTSLIDHLANYAKTLGTSRIEVATQLSNTQACRFYEKYGMHQAEVTYIYHFWL